MAIVALAVVIAGAVIWNGRRPGTTSAEPSTSPMVVTTPRSSAPPSASVSIPATTPTATKSPRPTVRPPETPPEVTGGEVDFRHFRVTVTRIRRTEGLASISAKVCVRRLPPNPQGDRTRISWGPWTVVTEDDRFRPRSPGRSADLAGMFPPDAIYRVGTCAKGWIPFPDVERLADVRSVRYKNGVGDVAEWRVES